MKKVLMLIPLLISSHFILAQETVELQYLFTGSEGKSSVNIIQYLNNGKSLELMVAKGKLEKDSVFSYKMDQSGNEDFKVFTKRNPRIPFILKDQKSSQLFIVDGLGFKDRILTKDTLNNFN